MAIKSFKPQLLILLAPILAGTIVIAGTSFANLRSRSLTALENRLADIHAELATLANYSVRGDAGAVGYRSNAYPDNAHHEWVKVEFSTAHTLDELVLIPVIRRHPKTGFTSDGFPQHIRVVAGTAENPEGQVITEYSANPELPPRIAPLVLPCHGITASWIRIEAERLATRIFDNKYVLQLSEIMAFSGPDNVALHQSISAKSSWRNSRAWAKQRAVDGLIPYLMDAADEEQSVAFMCRLEKNELPSLTIDLHETLPVSRLNLHAIDSSHILPQANPSSLGIPHGMQLTGANLADFSDETVLLDIKIESIYDMAPIMSWAFPESTNRYIRLTLTAPPVEVQSNSKASRFGFAEIELFSNGKNIALHTSITCTKTTTHPNRSLPQLTDGLNMYGTILPMRDWMRQLAQRYDLEAELPDIEAELSQRYNHQKTNLQRLVWLSALLATGIGFTILIDQLIRQRQVTKLKERFAADLHDELGANLHTIGLLSDLAEELKEDPEELSMLHRRIRSVTERTGTAMRHCTNMLAANGLYSGLEKDMQRAAERILAKLDHELSINGAEYLNQLKPRARIDLFLFYKEALINISRHSGASQFSTRLEADRKKIQLYINDNGRGLSQGVPSSLKRRARLLGANVTIQTPIKGGTGIHLTLKTRSWGRHK